MLRVVTLNTWKCDGDYFARLSMMCRELGKLDADVLCLQECFVAESGVADGGERKVGSSADTGQTLAKALGMRPFFAPARRKPRDFQGETVLSSSGLATLVRPAAFAAAAGIMEVLHLPQDARDGARIAQGLTLYPTDGHPIRIVNLHLTHLRDRDDLRAAQLEMVLARWGRGRTPTLLAGDFNAAFNDDEFRALRERSDLDVGPLDPQHWPNTLHTGTSLRAIDHLLLLRGYDCPSSAIPQIVVRRRVLDCTDASGLLPSDHAGILIELAWQ